MRERSRRHDDAHYPMGGRGKRATPPKGKSDTIVLKLTREQVVKLAHAVGDQSVADPEFAALYNMLNAKIWEA